MLISLLNIIDEPSYKVIFTDIYNNYRKQMFFLAESIVKNEADAEDIVHTVFLNIAQKHMQTVSRINDPSDMRNYLLTAVKNTALNQQKKQRKTVLTDDITFYSEARDYSDADFTDYIMNKFEYELIVRIIGELSDTYKDVLYFYFVLDMPVKEIAEHLDRSVSAVKKQITRGKNIIINKLERSIKNE